MNIRNAEKRDYSDILRLNKKDVLMLSEMDEGRLNQMHQICELFKVVEIDGKVVAFIIVFSSDSTYDGDNYRWFLNHFDKFLYVDRIVVDENYRKLGIAKRLYEDVFSHAVLNDYSLVCAEIDIKPIYNESSMKFHEKLGFREIGTKPFQKTVTVSLQIKRF